MAWMDKITGAFKKMKDATAGKPVSDALPEMLPMGDPRTLIRPLGGDWLCPFSLTRVATPSWNGAPETLLKCEEILNYLLVLGDLGKITSSTPMKDFKDLLQTTLFLRAQGMPSHKVVNESGEWICPYCLENTGMLLINWDGSETPFGTFYPDVLRHLDNCRGYKSEPLNPHSLPTVKEASGPIPLLRKQLTNDSRFRLFDSTGAWLCPFTERTVPTINAKAEQWPALQAKIIQYLMSEACPGKFNQWKVEKSEAALKAGLR